MSGERKILTRTTKGRQVNLRVGDDIEPPDVRNEWWCVYTHAFNGEVFYVGCGDRVRPLDVCGRAPEWRLSLATIPEEDVIDVAILGWFRTRAEALKVERHEIASRRPWGNVQHRMDYWPGQYLQIPNILPRRACDVVPEEGKEPLAEWRRLLKEVYGEFL